jgi:hypothetical protein
MGYAVRNPNHDERLPDAREDNTSYYSLDELHGAQWIASPRMEEDYDEWFILKDGRTVCLYSIDLEDNASDTLTATPSNQPN